MADRMAPYAVSGFTQVSAGLQYTCAAYNVAGDLGGAACWGLNADGQLGDGTTAPATRPAPVSLPSPLNVGVTAGGSHACGQSGGRYSLAWYCWGANANGQLGDGTTIGRPRPMLVVGGLSLAAVSAGGDHTCAVTTQSAAYCWGLNDNGQLGDGTTLQRTRPVPVTAGLGWAAVSSGTQHTCGVMAGGTAYCWGLNDHGQLSDGTTTQRTNPMLVAGGLRFIEVSAGATYCWGANASGQLGDGTTSDRSVPAKVAGQP